MTRQVIFILMLSGVWAQAQTGFVVPQFAVGGVLEGILFVANKTEETVDVEVYLRTGDADFWGGPWKVDGFTPGGSEFTFRLGPKQTRKLVLTGGDETLSGYLNVITREGIWARLSVSFFYNVVSDDGTLIDSTGVPPTGIRTTTVFTDREIFTYKYTATMEVGPGVNTGIAITHGLRDPVASNGRIRLTLYDELGNAIRIQTIENDGHSARFINRIWTDLPSRFVGMLQAEPIDEDTTFYLTVLRLEDTPSGFQLTSIPPDMINEVVAGGACVIEVVSELW